MSGAQYLGMIRVDTFRCRRGRRFVAGAEVYRDGDRLRWGRVAPILYWWRHQTPARISMWLRGPAATAGWRHRWLRCP